ncbi:MAG: hypothetical protein Q8P61_05640 [Candidatus Nanopelagicales bacterium]|nr:hypothetical protein [Candidatus Nanopelagicales bacterium]
MSLVPKEAGALSTGDDLNAILGILVDRVPGVNAAVIFHGSGLALSGVATCLDEVDVEAEEASALGAGLMQAATAALDATSTGGSTSGSTGGFRSVWVRSDEQSMYCVQIGEDAFAAASTDPDVPAGLLMYRMDKWAKKARAAFEKYGEIDIPEEALPRRRHSHIQQDHSTLKAKEVSAEDLGPVGAGQAPSNQEADGLGEDESASTGATALYAAAMAATTVGLAKVAEPEAVEAEVAEPEEVEPTLSGDWLLVDVPEPPVAPPAPEPAPEPVAFASPETPVSTITPSAPFGLAPEQAGPPAHEPTALADAMEAWLAPPPPAATAAPHAPAPVTPPMSTSRPPVPSTWDLSFAPPPAGAPVVGFPPPGAQAAQAAQARQVQQAPPPAGAPVVSFPPPGAQAAQAAQARQVQQAQQAQQAPQAPPPVQFPRPAGEVWAPAPPVEAGAGETETSPWAAYGGPPTGSGRS